MPASVPQGAVDAVIFDIGRVLYEWDPRYLFERRIADPARLDWFLANVVTLQWHFQHDAGRSLAPMLAELTSAHPDERPLIAAYVPCWLETIPNAVPGSLRLLQALDEAGVPLYGITNFGVEFWERFRPGAPLLDLLRDIIVSGAEKLVKPDPAIFRLAETRFGVDPARALFIDDSRTNVESAADCGFQTHHFRDAPTLRADLLARGLIHPA